LVHSITKKNFFFFLKKNVINAFFVYKGENYKYYCGSLKIFFFLNNEDFHKVIVHMLVCATIDQELWKLIEPCVILFVTKKNNYPMKMNSKSRNNIDAGTSIFDIKLIFNIFNILCNICKYTFKLEITEITEQ
jgi:hypothetical protein